MYEFNRSKEEQKGALVAIQNEKQIGRIIQQLNSIRVQYDLYRRENSQLTSTNLRLELELGIKQNVSNLLGYLQAKLEERKMKLKVLNDRFIDRKNLIPPQLPNQFNLHDNHHHSSVQSTDPTLSLLQLPKTNEKLYSNKPRRDLWSMVIKEGGREIERQKKGITQSKLHLQLVYSEIQQQKSANKKEIESITLNPHLKSQEKSVKIQNLIDVGNSATQRYNADLSQVRKNENIIRQLAESLLAMQKAFNKLINLRQSDESPLIIAYSAFRAQASKEICSLKHFPMQMNNSESDDQFTVSGSKSDISEIQVEEYNNFAENHLSLAEQFRYADLDCDKQAHHIGHAFDFSEQTNYRRKYAVEKAGDDVQEDLENIQLNSNQRIEQLLEKAKHSQQIANAKLTGLQRKQQIQSQQVRFSRLNTQVNQQRTWCVDTKQQIEASLRRLPGSAIKFETIARKF